MSPPPDPAGVLVSVIIPAYNRAWSLPACVRSVFAQTHRPVECIVVDDGSTDETPAVLAGVAAECPAGVALRVLREPHRGANAARNRGLRAAQGVLLCFLDSDDRLLPESVAARVAALEQNPGADFAYGLCSVRDERDAELRRMNEPWPAPGRGRIARYLFHTGAPLLRRSLCRQVGDWREDDPAGLELEYFARAKRWARDAVFIERPLSVYTKHSRGSIFDGAAPFFHANLRMLHVIAAEIRGTVFDTAAERAELAAGFRAMGGRLYRLGDFAGARGAYRDSLRLRKHPKAWLRWLSAAWRARRQARTR